MIFHFDRAQLQRMFQHMQLGRVAKALTALAQDAVAIATRPGDDTMFPPGASKLGGAPDLPSGLPWPDWNGIPLAFCAQIALTDVHHQAQAVGLPGSGLLSFFIDYQQRADGSDASMRDGWRVLFFPHDTALLRTALPAVLPAQGRFGAATMLFYAGLSLPANPTVRSSALQLTDDERRYYENWYSDQQTALPAPRHQLFGEATQLQDDIFLTCTQAAPGLRDPAHAAQDWQLLLQLDSDEACGMQWGSAGMLSFVIERSALAARQFDQAWAVLQSD